MGRNAYELKSGDIIVTVLLSRLSLPAKIGLNQKRNYAPPSELEGIQHISADFLNIKSRTEGYAKKTALKALG